jgi:hypothetical protein
LAAQINVVDAAWLGRKPQRPEDAAACRIYFTVADMEQAELIVRHRCVLKGSGTSIQDFLSPDELSAHRALEPVFRALREAAAQSGGGPSVQFQRGRLLVNKKDIPPFRR